jgi:predicted DNA-binding transcriptional regulator YafY
VADQRGEPRLFRVSRVASALADEAPVRRRDGVELADLWETLRAKVEDRPAEVPVLVRVRREVLDMVLRICAAHLADGAGGGSGDEGGEGDERVAVALRFAAVPAARTLLSFGADVEVVSPPQVRADLARTAAKVVARYS